MNALSRSHAEIENNRPISLSTANIRIISVAKTCNGFATVVIEVISKVKVRGRPRMRSRIEYNFETYESKPSAVANLAREFVLRLLNAA